MSGLSLTDPELSALSGVWILDPDRSALVIRSKALWVLRVTGTAKVLSGEGDVDPNGSVHGSLVVDAASIDTKMSRRDAHLRTADFFDVERYPTFTYSASAARKVDAGTEIIGSLSMHGQTHPLDLLAHVEAQGDTLTLSAGVDIDRRRWGVSWTKMGASPHNRLEITAHFDRA